MGALWSRWLKAFITAELILVLAIPFLGIAGYHTLLDSQAGRFVEPPTEHDPGWRALIEPTEITAMVETDADQTTGVTLMVGATELRGGSLILVPGTIVIEGKALGDRSPSDAVRALAQAMKLGLGQVDVLDAQRWSELLAGHSYELSNPDPVPDLPVGMVRVGADNVSIFLGRPVPGSDPATVMFRRELFWNAVAADPPAAFSDIAAVEVLHDLDQAEALVRELVPVPSGAAPGDRIQVRILDRTGLVDLEQVATEIASAGLEVIEIGNAEFDGGETQILVPSGIDPTFASDLDIGPARVLEDETDGVVTLVVGTDYLAEKGVDSGHQVGSNGR